MLITVEQFDALVAIVDEMLLFGNERLHRIRPPQPSDTARLTELHNRLRALRGPTGPEAA
jgi:hypothetical protein